MKYFFHTSNINQKIYKKLIWKYIHSILGKDRNIMNSWIIEVYPSSMSSQDPHFHGEDGVGGVTGMGKVKLYIEDSKTQFFDTFQRVFRRNSLMISHELSHAILIQLGRNEKVPLRHDDYSGHKAGTLLNYSTAEVHDRHTERRFFTLSFWSVMGFVVPKRFQASVLDFRNL